MLNETTLLCDWGVSVIVIHLTETQSSANSRMPAMTFGIGPVASMK